MLVDHCKGVARLPHRFRHLGFRRIHSGQNIRACVLSLASIQKNLASQTSCDYLSQIMRTTPKYPAKIMCMRGILGEATWKSGDWRQENEHSEMCYRACSRRNC